MIDNTGSTWGQLDTVTGSMTGSLEATESQQPTLTVLCHPELERIGERAVLGMSSPRRVARLSRLEPLFSAPGGEHRQALKDPRLSRKPLEIERATDGGVLIRGSEGRPRVTVQGQSLDGERRFSSEQLQRGLVILLAERVALLLHTAEVLLQPVRSFGLIGESAGIRAVRRQIARVADLQVPCLIRGESGTGKELVASAIHRGSPRRHQPFEAVNMGALPVSLAASELFGSSRGAFTGADRDRQGLFARADGGTLFLDEIGETPVEVQVMLLRTLETGRVRAVGADTEKAVDVRVVAATDADLEAAIEDGRFRAPLLHRLTGYELRLLPLRRQLDDLGRLLVHFLGQELRALGDLQLPLGHGSRPWLPASLVARLALFDWPGNVRQLRNVARQLVIASRGERQLHLTPELQAQLTPRPVVTPTFGAGADSEPAAMSQPVEARRPPESHDKVRVEALVAISTTVTGGDPSGATRARRRKLCESVLSEYCGRRVTASRAADGPGPETAGADPPDSGGFDLYVFERPSEAVGFALEYHQEMQQIAEQSGLRAEARIGIHLAEVRRKGPRPFPEATPGEGLAGEGLAGEEKPEQVEVGVPDRSRAVALAGLAAAGQTLLGRGVTDLAQPSGAEDHPLADPSVCWLEHGTYQLPGVTGAVEVCEVGIRDQAPLRRPPRAPAKTPPSRPTYRSPDDVGEDELLSALRAHAFRLQPTARSLGISRTSLYALIDRSEKIRKARDLSRRQIEQAATAAGGDLDAMAAELEVSRKGLRRRMTQLGFD